MDWIWTTFVVDRIRSRLDVDWRLDLEYIRVILEIGCGVDSREIGDGICSKFEVDWRLDL